MAWTKSLGHCRFALSRETGRPSAAACLSLSCLHCVLASCRRLAANHIITIIIIFVITRSCSSLKVFGVTWVKQQHYQRPRKFTVQKSTFDFTDAVSDFGNMCTFIRQEMTEMDAKRQIERQTNNSNNHKYKHNDNNYTHSTFHSCSLKVDVSCVSVFPITLFRLSQKLIHLW